MREKIVAGNWKMNNNQTQTEKLLKELKSKIKLNHVRVMVAPSFTQLSQSVNLLKGIRILVAAQNMNASNSGAYTGEISSEMLKGIGVNIVILGHSERRTLFNETSRTLARKVNAAIGADMEVIFCIGEALNERLNNNHFKVVENQLKSSLFKLPASAWKQLILAYEPVWAIGTGETANPFQVQEIHNYIRRLVALKYSQKIAENLSILYGGSVKPNNASEIFKQKDVDGGLIGGASLNADEFIEIINAI